MAEECPLFTPTEEEFSRPFVDYVGAIFRANPGIACFKVRPPPGWRPRSQPYPDMSRVMIKTPIRQHVFGKSGAYRCMLMEEKSLTVAEFEQLSREEAARTGGRRGCDNGEEGGSERAFWASVTMNPPMYGADTPVSFFDDMPYGWNFHNLGDLLQQYEEVPEIPGVTTPMCYFGSWRSFFGWHKEDADLMSINYLHFGAPKVWYSVSPKHADKFDRMAQALFPELARACPAFIRHKDLLISPTQLHNFGIPYTMCKHHAGEFMVLNASAYHAGFNTGFNCAEAINFGTQDWVKIGKAANHCTCEALKDAVRISMTIFDPNWKDPWAMSTSDEDEDDSGDPDSDNTHHHQQYHDASRAQLLSWAVQQSKQKRMAEQQGLLYPLAKRSALGVRRIMPVWRTASEIKPADDKEGMAPPPLLTGPVPASSSILPTPSTASQGRANSGGTSEAAVSLLRSAYAQLQQRKGRLSGMNTEDALPSHAGSPAARPSSAPVTVWVSSHPTSTPASAPVKQPILVVPRHLAKPTASNPAASTGPSAPDKPATAPVAPRPTPAPATATAADKPAASSSSLITPILRKDHNLPNDMRAAVHLNPAMNASATQIKPGPKVITSVSALLGRQNSTPAPTSPPPRSPVFPVSAPSPWPKVAGSPVKGSPVKDTAEAELLKELQRDPVQGSPAAIVVEDKRGKRNFHLVQQLKRPARIRNNVLLRLMNEGPDGLFYPSSTIWEEQKSTLVQVRTQVAGEVPYVDGRPTRLPAYKLLTLRSRILDVDLQD